MAAKRRFILLNLNLGFAETRSSISQIFIAFLLNSGSADRNGCSIGGVGSELRVPKTLISLLYCSATVQIKILRMWIWYHFVLHLQLRATGIAALLIFLPWTSDLGLLWLAVDILSHGLL